MTEMDERKGYCSRCRERIAAGIEPWQRVDDPMTPELLREMEEAFENPAVSSRGHRDTLRCSRRLHDEVTRLRKLCEEIPRWRRRAHALNKQLLEWRTRAEAAEEALQQMREGAS